MTKIMLVDDDKLVTDLLEKLLKSDGFETVAINDSSKSIELAKSEQPDLFLLDLMMPYPDGFRLSRMIREEPMLKNTPIIIVTALDDNDSRAVAYGAGATDYLTKPFHPDELKDIIVGLLIAIESGVSLNELARKAALRDQKISRTLALTNSLKSKTLNGRNVLWITFILLIIIFCVLLETLR